MRGVVGGDMWGQGKQIGVKNAGCGGGGRGARINVRPLGLGETKKTKKLKLAPKWMSSKPCILIFYTEFEFSHWVVQRGELSR